MNHSASLPHCLLLGFLLLGVAPGCSPNLPSPNTPPVPPVEQRLVRGLGIEAVTISQAVAIDLYRGGVEPEERTAPVLAGRPGLVRVHVEPGEDWQNRRVLGEMTLLSESLGEERVFQEEVHVAGPSQAEDHESTCDFVFSAGDLVSDSRIAVRLWEAEEPPTAAGDLLGSAWPEFGSLPLHASDWGGVVRLQLLPFIYAADGSDRLPDTSPEQIEVLTDNLMRLYPLREIEVEVLEPQTTDIEMLSDGTGFSDLLGLVADLRVEWEVPFDTAVFGMVAPAESQEDFCQFGCTAGLAYRVSNPRNSKFKSGVGLAYSGQPAARTLAHELGHIHDRAHAPCGGAGNPDEDFPYLDGGIGVEGWDILNEERVDPAEHDDVMGYCKPDWISDYNYDALHRRVSAVEGLREERDTLTPQSWLSFMVDGKGGAKSPRLAAFGFLPEGPELTVRLLDSEGTERGRSAASLMRYGDLPGGVVVLPAPGLDIVAVQLEGYPVLALPVAETIGG